MSTRYTPAPTDIYCSLLSHELRTPVTDILGYLQLLDADDLLNDPKTLREYLAVVQGRAASLARIVSELTSFTDLAIGHGLTPDDAAPASLPALIEAAAAGRPVQVEITPEAAETAIDADRPRLILGQLVDNAFQFGTPGSPVIVRVALSGDPPRLIVRVTNQGPPIPEALRETIFQPFRQAEDYLRRRQGGLGLGLLVARQAAEGAGGTLVLEPGAPTTFRVELPLRDDPVVQQARALHEQAARADAQALRAIQDLRALRETAAAHRTARELAEAQQLRAVADFRAAHQQALKLVGQLDRAYLETITSLAKAVEARDQYTGGHVERVRAYSLRLAAGLTLSREARRDLEFGAVLHDVGKVGVPDLVLGKPSQLDPAEWAIMKRHPEIGLRVLEGISFLVPALEAVGCHHERWDGRGYPDGLAGDAIPLFGRIVAIVDAYDAMVTDRPYRKGMPVEVALRIIEEERGTQFDPDLAAAFLAHPPERSAP